MQQPIHEPELLGIGVIKALGALVECVGATGYANVRARWKDFRSANRRLQITRLLRTVIVVPELVPIIADYAEGCRP